MWTKTVPGAKSAGVPECLSAARLRTGNRLDPSVALNLLDAEPAVLVGSAYDVAFLDVC